MMASDGGGSFHDPSTMVPALERAFLNFNMVEERLVEAMGVLLRSADREWGWLNPGTLAMWRQVKPDVVDPVDGDKPMMTCALTRAEVARADEAMAWIVASVEAGIARRIVGIALMQLALGDRARIEWPAVLRRLGRDGKGWTTDRLRMRYGRAISAIANAQNARTLAG